jgi:hypothetical protein
VWVGVNALVVSGIRVGQGGVPADLPPLTIAEGNPARFLLKRCQDAEIATLIETAWWDWPPRDEVLACKPILTSGVDR